MEKRAGQNKILCKFRHFLLDNPKRLGYNNANIYGEESLSFGNEFARKIGAERGDNIRSGGFL